MRFFKKLKKNKGFTLIEMIIYATVLGFMVSVSINSTFAMLRAFGNIRVSHDVNNSALVSLERMVSEIRIATGIDGAQSTFSANPGVLFLDTLDSGGSPATIEFYVEGGSLKVKQDGVAQGVLTSQNVVIDNLVFYSASNSNSEAVKIELQLTGTRGNISKTRKFYGTAVLRGTY